MTFDFTIDAFPGFTNTNKAKKVQFVLQVIDVANAGMHNYSDTHVHGHREGQPWDTSMTSPTESIYQGEVALHTYKIFLWATEVTDPEELSHFSDIEVYKSTFLRYVV